MSLKTARDLAAALAAGETTSREVTEKYLAAIESLNPTLNAYITTLADEALAAAEASDGRRKTGQTLSPLDGVPIAIKDNICTRGVKTTCASKMLEEFRPPYNATVVTKLEASGLINLGKVNMDEFAMGSSTEHSHVGPSRNPWNPNFVPGGSSGGSAVAVAAGMAPWSLGSDTGGSIRQPASFCGIVGLKPTYGRVSRYGLVAFASSLDQIGPLSVDVQDAALLLEVIAGHDDRDSTSSSQPTEKYTEALVGAKALDGLKVARPVEFFETEGIDPEVSAACEKALQTMKDAGATIVDVKMPHAEEYSVSTYYVLATAEASSNLARYDGAHYGYREPGTQNIVEMFSKTRAAGFGAEVKRRIMLGTFVLSAETFDAYYRRAAKARTLIQKDYAEALEKADVIFAPTAPSPAFKFGDKTADPLTMYLSDIFTLSLNLAGYCGISLPIGHSEGGLPIGAQLFGGAFQESKLLASAHGLEEALGIANRRAATLAAV
ncbi:MAG: Asp-tRNA(Asn)/Glu-tRNA(Gln) amidotransferase subunit GatA [Sumerlaeia bacterium]